MLIHVLNGLVYGGLLYLVAVGLVLIFGLRQVVNFAHGSLFMLGAYVAYATIAIAGFWIGLLAAAIVLALLGLLLDRTVFRQLQDQDPIVTVLVTFGLLLVLEDFVRTVWGRDNLTVAVPQLLQGTVDIAGASFPIYRLFVIAAAAVIGAGLTIWLKTSRVGLYVRAFAADPVTTGMQGVDTERVSASVVAVGAGLAGLSGAIASPLLALSPAMGGSILIESFIVVVVGGFGSFSGAFVAALVIGQLQNFGIVFVPSIASMVPFLLMMAILIYRPEGLAGKAS
ncbi:branched-chain amino acid ABC transporter permease [Bosea lathyri]|uniref:Amino acid/amide ABC transporter membrane protein 1, HAAT family n=1 Tax=Bosea lathyri TaxID=1036778 RepID=A0A1H5S737_9HYPH|nr:branched-chain amino acid ABC transporter permease [Bosea lathyri]SEF45627.1 amino acid/amide ABC transporter membrane protein 1, HAAT family [Bosea lathyri]